jgi:hypothetical protein
MSDQPATVHKSAVPFVLATFCTLPFVAGFVIYATFLMTHKESLVNFVVIGLMFGWPVLAILAVIGIVLILISWFSSSSICRAFLFLYFLVIVGFVLFGFFALSNLGPM